MKRLAPQKMSLHRLDWRSRRFIPLLHTSDGQDLLPAEEPQPAIERERVIARGRASRRGFVCGVRVSAGRAELEWLGSVVEPSKG